MGLFRKKRDFIGDSKKDRYDLEIEDLQRDISVEKMRVSNVRNRNAKRDMIRRLRQERKDLRAEKDHTWLSENKPRIRKAFKKGGKGLSKGLSRLGKNLEKSAKQNRQPVRRKSKRSKKKSYIKIIRQSSGIRPAKKKKKSISLWDGSGGLW